MVQLSHPYMITGKTIALIIHTFVSKVMSLLFNMLSRFVIGFLPRSKHLLISWLQFLGGSDSKASACNSRDLGLIPGSGRSPAEGNGNPLQYSCLENPMNGGAWWATVHGVAESDTTEQLHLHLHLHLQDPVTNHEWLFFRRVKPTYYLMKTALF